MGQLGLFQRCLFLAVCVAGRGGAAADNVYPSAVLPFQERGADVKNMGAQVADLLFARLAADPRLHLVERADLDSVLKELALNRSGIVKPEQAVQVGQLTGAKILITGSVLQVDSKVYLVAKVIGTETTRVLGASVKGPVDGGVGQLAEELAQHVAKLIGERAKELTATPPTRADRVSRLQAALAKGRRPAVRIDVRERHVGQATIDPAAQTELAWYCQELGFEVLDPAKHSDRRPDILLTGEGLSEFAARHGDLISVKARLEVKAVEVATGRQLAVDRQAIVGADLTEQIAGKTALQEAAAAIAERLLPRLVKH